MSENPLQSLTQLDLENVLALIDTASISAKDAEGVAQLKMKLRTAIQQMQSERAAERLSESQEDGAA